VLLHQVIQTYYHSLSIYCFSTGIAFPPAEPLASRSPAVIRIGTRGDCSSVHSDISSLELYMVGGLGGIYSRVSMCAVPGQQRQRRSVQNGCGSGGTSQSLCREQTNFNHRQDGAMALNNLRLYFCSLVTFFSHSLSLFPIKLLILFLEAGLFYLNPSSKKLYCVIKKHLSSSTLNGIKYIQEQLLQGFI
jgi:hypothetical protein